MTFGVVVGGVTFVGSDIQGVVTLTFGVTH